jgi:hypothetical protein
VLAPSDWKSRISGKDWPVLAKLPWIWAPPESAHHRFKVALLDQEASMLDLVKSEVGPALVRESHAHSLVISDTVNLST